MHACALRGLLGVGHIVRAKVAVRQGRGIDYGFGVPFGAAFGVEHPKRGGCCQAQQQRAGEIAAPLHGDAPAHRFAFQAA